MTYEQLPPETQKWLSATEEIINKWDWMSKQLPEVRGELSVCDRLAASLEAQTDAAADRMRQDEALLRTFKGQVDANLADAREAESDFVRRYELQAYGRRGVIPSPYFAARLQSMAAEVSALRERIAQLDGAVSSRSKPPLTIEGLHDLLCHHKALFDAAASKLQSQHERVDQHRRFLRTQLRRDPFDEARNREAAVRDKYKPADGPVALTPQLPAPAAPGVPGAPGAPATGGALGFPGAAANPFGGTPSAAVGGAAANPFGGGALTPRPPRGPATLLRCPSRRRRRRPSAAPRAAAASSARPRWRRRRRLAVPARRPRRIPSPPPRRAPRRPPRVAASLVARRRPLARRPWAPPVEVSLARQARGRLRRGQAGRARKRGKPRRPGGADRRQQGEVWAGVCARVERLPCAGCYGGRVRRPMGAGRGAACSRLRIALASRNDVGTDRPRGDRPDRALGVRATRAGPSRCRRRGRARGVRPRTARQSRCGRVGPVWATAPLKQT